MKAQLEDLDQETLDMLVDMAQQRAVFAACLVNVIQHNSVEKEALNIKKGIMHVVTQSLMGGLVVNDDIQKYLLDSMKKHCEEQIEIEELLNGI